MSGFAAAARVVASTVGMTCGVCSTGGLGDCCNCRGTCGDGAAAAGVKPSFVVRLAGVVLADTLLKTGVGAGVDVARDGGR